MSERLIPVAGRLVVRRDDAPRKIGNIHLPDGATASTEMTTGTVLAIGPYTADKLGMELSPNQEGHQLQVGDKVAFEIYTGNSFADERRAKGIVILKAEDILAIVED